MSAPYGKEDPMDNKKGDDAEIYVTDAVPTQDEGPPIPADHARFYCSSCHTPYDLPQSATSWRCARCSTFNSITLAECPSCTIL